MNYQEAHAKRRVLIVDDNADAALVLSMCLSAYGHETAVAYGGEEGIELAESFRPEIIFLDLGMPKMSGYEVAVALRRLPCLATVYIAALTCWNDPKTREQVVAAGFDKHLTKPAKVEVVLDLVEHAGA
jgi:CheY-like chemotaxis protein